MTLDEQTDTKVEITRILPKHGHWNASSMLVATNFQSKSFSCQLTFHAFVRSSLASTALKRLNQ